MSTRPPIEINLPSSSQPSAINEIRYSLPDILTELQMERSTGSFSQEKLHQVEIGKLFGNRKKRRGKTSA